MNFASFISDTKKTVFKKAYYACLKNGSPVKNTIKLKKNMIITGPNASGKTTILKSTLINIIFTQQFGCGFYESADIAPFNYIHCYLNIPDTSGRDSLFQAESRRCKEILDTIQVNNEKCHHFCIFDELYSGTNPKEAGKSAYAFLKYLSKFEHVDFMLTTHYVFVCNKFKKSKRIRNYKMDVENIPKELGGGFKYTYLVKPGISKIEGAINILKEMNYPKELLDNIEECN
jgi:DNA mismatch repair ATPase MutS